MMQSVCVNDVIRDVEQEKSYRILWVSNPPEYVYWISLHDTGTVPKKIALSVITEALETERFEITSEPNARVINEGTLTKEEKKRRDKIWAILGKALENEPDIFEAKRRTAILREVERISGWKINNLYPYLAKYWKRGKTPNAFLPDYRNCGRSRDYQKGEYKKLGRPSENAKGFGKKLQETDFQNFEKAIRKYYLTRKEITFQATYERMLADFYATEQQDDKGETVLQLFPEDAIPSISQFRYWYQKNLNLKEEIKKRKGEVKYELTSRAVLGKSDYGLMGPGSKYQIDATVGDVYLVSQFNRANIIGRPVMYFVIDAFSRMVTGMYVGLEGPSWVGAMMAIANAACDKVSYCQEYGISITEEQWPCHHIPAVLLGDRGEMESRNADNLVSMLGVRIENSPPYRADLKGIIEQHFRTINTNANVFLPGKVKPDMKERGGKDYRLDAKLDIRQFTAIIIKCVLYYNNSHYMDNFEKNAQMMENSVEAIPIKLWNWGIRYCSGTLRTAPEEQVKLALMPMENASITGRGIKFKGLYYSSKEAVEGLWFEKARSKGSYRVKVSYDPRDMGKIYVWEKNCEIPISCFLLDWEEKYSGKQLSEVQYEQETEKQEKRLHHTRETEAKINLGREIDSIIQEAEQMSSSSGGQSKTSRLAGIRQNRKEEREQLRKQEAFTANEKDNETEQAQGEQEVSPVLQMIRRKMEESINDELLLERGQVSGTSNIGISGESVD